MQCVLGTDDDEIMITPKRAKMSPEDKAESDEDEEDILTRSDPVAEIIEQKKRPVFLII